MEQNLLDDGIDRSENLRGRANHDSHDVNWIYSSDLFVGWDWDCGGEMWDQHIYYHAFQSLQRLGPAIWRFPAVTVRDGRMSTSAEMPSVACRRRIMLIDKLRRRLRTSATRVLVPIIGSSCLRVSFFWLILNLMASIGSGDSIAWCVCS